MSNTYGAKRAFQKGSSSPFLLNKKANLRQQTPQKSIPQINLLSQPPKQIPLLSLAASIPSKSSYQKKQFISMDETLGFLKFINMNEQDAFRQENLNLQVIHQQHVRDSQQGGKKLQKKDSRHKQFVRTGINSNINTDNVITKENEQYLKKGTDTSQDQSIDSINQNRKKLNKNRAIKRVIQTSFGILQKNYRDGTTVSNSKQDEQKPTSTQLNIYLKQYNRILQQINSKQIEQIEKRDILDQENEQQLQRVFEYTVSQDFRQRLQVLFTKDKISKQNVQSMIEVFRPALLILKLQTLSIKYSSLESSFTQQPIKRIKLTQIQNVQYYTQPYIFIVLTINKDKTKSQQYLYVRFVSQENQDKWDRALYSCFVLKKMNKKTRLFEIQFPVDDVMKKEKQEFKKNDQVYDLFEDKTIIRKCFTNDQQNNSFSPNQSGTTKKIRGQNDEFTISIIDAQGKDDKSKRMNTSQSKTKIDSSFKNIQINSSNKIRQTNSVQIQGQQYSRANTFTSKHSKQNSKKQGNNVLNSGQQQYQSGNLSKKSTLNPLKQTQSLQNQTLRNNSSNKQVAVQPQPNPFLKLLKIAQQQSQRSKHSQVSKSQLYQNEQSSMNKSNQNISQEKLNMLRRLREIQKTNIRGIVCQKEKFFINKEKILYFCDQSMNSARNHQAQSTQLNKQKVNNITNTIPLQQQVEYLSQISSKYIQYWDYDYKKSVQTLPKQVFVQNIRSFNMVGNDDSTTTSLTIIHGNDKELKLMFANGKDSKAKDVEQWISMITKIIKEP